VTTPTSGSFSLPRLEEGLFPGDVTAPISTWRGEASAGPGTVSHFFLDPWGCNTATHQLPIATGAKGRTAFRRKQESPIWITPTTRITMPSVKLRGWVVPVDMTMEPKKR
jgi:hypothetical protein